MTEDVRHFTTDLAVIGSGIAGFASSIFALNRGLKTAQVGNTGAVAYTTGYLDLLGGLEDSEIPVSDPWLGIEHLRAQAVHHPLARILPEEIRESFNQFTDFISECGIAYSRAGDINISALTPVGTLKKTLCVPKTMEIGPQAMADQAKCIIIDFRGLKGFSGRQVVANLKEQWPGISAKRLTFPDMDAGEIYPEVMARALEVAANREKLAEQIKDEASDAEVIGLPALLGIHNPDFVREELEKLTGKKIFEIPTMPPSVPGIRLRELFEQVFPQKGVTLIPQQKVTAVDFNEQSVNLKLSDNYGAIEIDAQTVILATGRFLSGGLEARINGITEPLLNIPVTQPDNRTDWYHEKYTDPRGHAIHQAGIEVDDRFRPLNHNGDVVDERLFAAGVILAHQDWIRGRSGAGIAIATAYKSVEAAAQYLSA